MWGSLWLYVATGEQKYMDNLEKLMVEKRIGDEAGNSFYQACNPYRQAIV